MSHMKRDALSTSCWVTSPFSSSKLAERWKKKDENFVIAITDVLEPNLCDEVNGNLFWAEKLRVV